MSCQRIKNIFSFKILENNWDGYGAIPAEIESASNAVTFVSYLDEEVAGFIYDVFPNPNGTISFLWENNSKERLSLEVGNQTMSYYLKLNSQKPQIFNNKHINKFTQRIYKLIDKKGTRKKISKINILDAENKRYHFSHNMDTKIYLFDGQEIRLQDNQKITVFADDMNCYDIIFSITNNDIQIVYHIYLNNN